MPCIWMIYNPELDKELQEEEVIDLICFVYLWAKRRNTIDGCLVLGLDGHFLLNRCTRISFIVFFFFFFFIVCYMSNCSRNNVFVKPWRYLGCYTMACPMRICNKYIWGKKTSSTHDRWKSKKTDQRTSRKQRNQVRLYTQC